MSKGPRITPTAKKIIAARAIKDPKSPRQLVALEVQELLDKMGERQLAQETLEKEISKARNRPKSLLDGPWSVGCLSQYDIPPEALPIVMFIYKKRLRDDRPYFTIRKVLWIARLHKLVADPIVLEDMAEAYALREQINWILDSEPETRDLDIGVIAYTEGEIIDFMPRMGLPAWGKEEREELENKLKKKGYKLQTG